MAKTFLGLLQLADLKGKAPQAQAPKTDKGDEQTESEKLPVPPSHIEKGITGLHYNIQIHLPATKDVEVYNAIFKSLKEHLLER